MNDFKKLQFFEKERIFRYLRWNSYRSERHRLFYVAVPRAACTSLKWWFANLEGCAQALRDITQSAESDPDLVVHDSFHKVAPHVTLLPNKELVEALTSEAYFRFAVVRNPYKRIFSAWQSKLLLQEPLQAGPYVGADFLNHPVESIGDLAAAFELFLVYLAENEAPVFRDFHWTPQAALLRPDVIRYTRLVKLENPAELGLSLSGRTGKGVPDPFSPDHFNGSMIPYFREAVTERSAELIRMLYEEDFRTFGYDVLPPPPGKNFTQDQFDLARQSIRIIRNRHQRLEETTRQITGLERKIIRQNFDFREMQASLTRMNKELAQKTTALHQTEKKLDLKTKELERKTIDIDRILSSKSWLVTKPLRTLLDLFGRISGQSSPGSGTTAAAANDGDGRARAQELTINEIRLPVVPGGSSYEKGEILKKEEGGITSWTGRGMQAREQAFRSPYAILLVGHDAKLAGAQVLFLSLARWFREHTGINIRILLLEGGVLLDEFRSVAPTSVWKDMLQNYPVEKERQARLRDFTGEINLVYGNTSLAPSVYDKLEYLQASYVTHVHELENVIRNCVAEDTLSKMRVYSDGVVACSSPVELNLIRNHQIDLGKIITVNAFADKREIPVSRSKAGQRKTLGLAEEGLLVICCGTMEWRKGVDLFIQTALKLEQKGLSRFHFCWIGKNIWEEALIPHGLASWSDLEQIIERNGLHDFITFTGVKHNVYDYLRAGDVFYLPSREDPFPLVCLEAAQCSLPVLCFEDAGGMPDFVEKDAGYVVPFEDTESAADKLLYLSRNPGVIKVLGANAREKFLLRHSTDSAMPEILNFCRWAGRFPPAVSVIVPFTDPGRYLEKRLESIIQQTFRDFEIILAGNFSTVRGLELIRKFAQYSFIKVVIDHDICEKPFGQWQKAISAAQGAILWFAGAEDFCEPDFLEKLMPKFHNSAVALAYCDSGIVDENDTITGDYGQFYESLDPLHWNSSYQVSGVREINHGLGLVNTLPSPGAVLIRKSAVPGGLPAEVSGYGSFADWFFYTQVIKDKYIAFVAEKLNYHRKPGKESRPGPYSDDPALFLREEAAIHERILENYRVGRGFIDKWGLYTSGRIRTPNTTASKENIAKYYPGSNLEAKIKAAIAGGEKSRKLVFITTLDYSPNGGSEQLWIQTALNCSRLGHRVAAVIKEWDPAPYFIRLLEDSGAEIIYKGRDELNRVLGFQPDLVVISLGDMDEGTEWYAHLRACSIPYVIINQLTKEPEYWPVRADINNLVREGYLAAEKIFFTCLNNHRLMEKRLGCELPNAGIHFNPLHVERDSMVPFPSMNNGLKIAIPANLSRVHKGQHLVLELMNLRKWRKRPVQVHFYGNGHDEAVLKAMARKYGLDNVVFHDHTNDLISVWRANHALMLPSFMEGLPLVLVGAMLCARVPVLTNVGAHGEIVEDNISGFIAQKPSVEALDEALERAFNRAGSWEEIGRRARQRILSYLPPADPVDDFISKIIPLTDK